MTTHSFKIPFLLLITICTIACKGGEKKADGDVVVQPSKTTLEGELYPYYEVVDKDYGVDIFEEAPNENGAEIIVEFKRTNIDFPKDFNTSTISTMVGMNNEMYAVLFTLKLLDGNGDLIAEKNSDSPFTVQGIIDLLNMDKGSTGSVPWMLNKDEVKNLASFAVGTSLKLIPAIDAAKRDEIRENRNTANADTSGNNEWDLVISNFEALKKEELNALSEYQKDYEEDAMENYAEVQKKGVELSKRLNKAQENGLLSDGQKERLIKLQQEFLLEQTKVISKKF